MLATGSASLLCSAIPGNDLAGCFVYLLTISTVSPPMPPRRGRLVVIGGRLLRLEAANALKRLGLETQVVGCPEPDGRPAG
ncbi:hypothetical protein MJ561_17920 [Klebsiella pneumoniae]|nr:hypothetical protein MJ561_17920 [Klebsiella pneumoniae]